MAKKKLIPPGPHFSPAERERLYLLMGELGESVQAVAKILRFGYESKHPVPSVHGFETNREQLQIELGQVAAAIALMSVNGDLSVNDMAHSTRAKLRTVRRWLLQKHKYPKL